MRPQYPILIFALLFCVFISHRSIAQVAPDKPNIIIIIVDDGRYDEYPETGAPEWYETPGISRIANEGVNFTRTYAQTPICGPSRAALYSGKYGHLNGVENNWIQLNDSIKLIQQILRKNGYYTGFVGKYGGGMGQPKGFDYWVNSEDEKDYTDLEYVVNGSTIFIPGHVSDVFDSLAMDFLKEAKLHQPFALFYFHRVPHNPCTPAPGDEALYTDEEIPFPANFYNFPALYPNFYYENSNLWEKDSLQTIAFKLKRFQALQSVDESVSHIFDFLDSNAITDSTFLLYASDNGYIIGEHMMRAKVYAIEESIHVPLFVRYPPWFTDSTTVDDDIAILLDIPATLLDVSNIPDTYGFQGESLQTIAAPGTQRPYFMYEYGGGSESTEHIPDVRGIRSLDYLYVNSACNCNAEEFYDFITDPQQNTNQILNPAYQALIDSFRLILAEMRSTFNDTLPDIHFDCSITGSYEILNGMDDDCDGLIDEELVSLNYYEDYDGDGYGNAMVSVISMDALPGYVLNNTDCNDSSAYVYPGAIDYCNSLDDDCDLIVDEDTLMPLITPSGSIILCKGSEVTIVGSPVLPGVSYQWYFNGVAIADAVGSSLIARHAGTYHVEFSGPAGCMGISPELTITLNTIPKPGIKNHSASNDICISNPIELSTKFRPGCSFQWYRNGEEIPGATSKNYSVTNIGNYQVEITDSTGCTSSSTKYQIFQSCRESMPDSLFTDGITVFPNPAGKEFSILVHADANREYTATVTMINMLGQSVYVTSPEKFAGIFEKQISVTENMHPGVYLLEIQIDNRRLYSSVVLQ